MSILHIIDLAYRLKSITRKGWIKKVSIDVLDAESVADHSYLTALITMLLSDLEGLDTYKAIKIALLHDLAESIIGDYTPEEIDEDVKHKIEDKAMKVILDSLPDDLRISYTTLWREYLNNNSKEAVLVHEVDKLEMSIQAYKYEKMGYNKVLLREFHDSALRYIRDEYIKGLIKDLKKDETI